MLDAGRLVEQGTHAELLANGRRNTEGRLVPTDTVLTIAPAERAKRPDDPVPPDRLPTG